MGQNRSQSVLCRADELVGLLITVNSREVGIRSGQIMGRNRRALLTGSLSQPSHDLLEYLTGHIFPSLLSKLAELRITN